MRHTTKVSPARLLVRKVAARRAFPAWIDSEQGLSFASTQVTPRVRDGLVLRIVSQKKPARSKGISDAHRAR